MNPTDPDRQAWLDYLADQIAAVTHRYERRAAARAAGQPLPEPEPTISWEDWQRQHAGEPAEQEKP